MRFTKPMSVIDNQSGNIMVLFCCLMPVFLAFMGIVMDFAWIMHNEMLLDEATQAAGDSIILALDIGQSSALGLAVLDQDKAEEMATSYLQKNVETAQVVACEFPNPNEMTLNTKVVIPTVFLRLFDMETVEVTSKTFSKVTYTGG